MPVEIPQLPLFVYGTLLSGERNFNHYLAGRVAAIEAASLDGRLFLYPPGGYPFILAGKGRVQGELIHIRPDAWSRVIRDLDRLEDYQPEDEAAGWYLRRRATAERADGTAVACWTYYWNRPATGQPIRSGEWRSHGAIKGVKKV